VQIFPKTDNDCVQTQPRSYGGHSGASPCHLVRRITENSTCLKAPNFVLLPSETVSLDSILDRIG